LDQPVGESFWGMPAASSTELKERVSRKGWSDGGHSNLCGFYLLYFLAPLPGTARNPASDVLPALRAWKAVTPARDRYFFRWCRTQPCVRCPAGPRPWKVHEAN
jgi:hypothetical protein